MTLSATRRHFHADDSQELDAPCLALGGGLLTAAQQRVDLNDDCDQMRRRFEQRDVPRLKPAPAWELDDNSTCAPAA